LKEGGDGEGGSGKKKGGDVWRRGTLLHKSKVFNGDLVNTLMGTGSVVKTMPSALTTCVSGRTVTL